MRLQCSKKCKECLTNNLIPEIFYLILYLLHSHWDRECLEYFSTDICHDLKWNTNISRARVRGCIVTFTPILRNDNGGYNVIQVLTRVLTRTQELYYRSRWSRWRHDNCKMTSQSQMMTSQYLMTSQLTCSESGEQQESSGLQMLRFESGLLDEGWESSVRLITSSSGNTFKLNV